jgi:hypothetical protein
MKTVKQAAEEYRHAFLVSEGTNIARVSHMSFEAGVEFAQRWVSVDEELPDGSEQMLLIRHNEGISTGFFSKNHAGVKNVFLFGSNLKNCLINPFRKSTHWKPIEYK